VGKDGQKRPVAHGKLRWTLVLRKRILSC
jgi:hypothetical protein